MFGPLDRACVSSGEAAWTVVATRSAPRAAHVILIDPVIVRPFRGEGLGHPDVMSSMRASPPADFAMDQGLNLAGD